MTTDALSLHGVSVIRLFNFLNNIVTDVDACDVLLSRMK